MKLHDFNKQFVQTTSHIETTDSKNNSISKPMMILPNAGEKGYTLVKSLKKSTSKDHFQLSPKSTSH